MNIVIDHAHHLVDMIDQREKGVRTDFKLLQELLSFERRIITGMYYPVQETDPIPSESIDFVF